MTAAALGLRRHARACSLPRRWWPARVAPATWASAVPATRIRARPPPTTCSRALPRRSQADIPPETERNVAMAKYAAALDQGTTSSRAMIFDHSGRVVAVSQKEHEQIYPKPGWVGHDPK